VQALENGEAALPLVLFASGTLPYRGIARFDYARWGLSRFAPQII
jgi:hypothetical protein